MCGVSSFFFFRPSGSICHDVYLLNKVFFCCVVVVLLLCFVTLFCFVLFFDRGTQRQKEKQTDRHRGREREREEKRAARNICAQIKRAQLYLETFFVRHDVCFFFVLFAFATMTVRFIFVRFVLSSQNKKKVFSLTKKKVRVRWLFPTVLVLSRHEC